MVGYMLFLDSSSLVSFVALADQELDFCLDTPYSECKILRAFGLVFRADTSLVVLSVACDFDEICTLCHLPHTARKHSWNTHSKSTFFCPSTR